MQTPAPPRPNVRGWTIFALLGEDEATPTNGAPASTPAQIRKRVVGGHFELGELLGHGGTSCVYACKNMAAAIKILTSGDEDKRRRFVDEGRILTNLRHPHLVQALAVGETDAKAPFMVLERLPGENLDARLQREGPLPWREAADLMAQVAAALGALHGAGVIHRDVKPANVVMVSSASGVPFVKLIDLGIAKVDDWQRVGAARESPPKQETGAGLFFGTEGFFPPEAPFVAPNPQFDIFGLGVTIYRLCTGEFPNHVDLRPMNAVRPECAAPDELETLVADALAMLPERRIATISEFQWRLDAIRSLHADDTSPFVFDGCYELIETIGLSAKSEIHRAYHRDRRQYVALKILREPWCGDAEQRARFAREAQVLSAVQHPALPTLIDCRTALTRKRPFIAMSIMRGTLARDLYFGGARLKPGEVIALGRELAGALAELHAHGIIHRDIHGKNVLIDVNTTKAALLDCGMVELTPTFYAKVDQRYPTPPEARTDLGTGGLEQHEWTAPEARAGKGWTTKSDVFSLGLLLYQLATGKAPRRDAQNQWTSPSVHAPDLPLALVTALENTLADDPDQRVDMRGLVAKLEDAATQWAENDLPDDAEAAPAASTVASPHVTSSPTPSRRMGLRAALGVGVAAGVMMLAVVFCAEPSVEAIDSSPPAPALINPPPASPPTPVVADLAEPLSASALSTDPWETRMREAEAGARQCLEAADVLPRRMLVAFAPGEPIEFTDVLEDSPHARCVGEALERLDVRTDIPRRHAFFATP